MRHPLSSEELQLGLQAVKPLTLGAEVLGVMAIITDQDGNILYANKPAEKVTGFTRDEMIGKNPADLWGGQMPKEFFQSFWQTVKVDKKPFMGEMHNRRKNGELYWQEIFITPILGEDGEVRFFLAVEPDITERKEKERFREEFASVLGHQLKNPLTAVNWTIELLLERNGLRPEQKKALLNVYADSQNMIGLIDDLLLLSRLNQKPKQEDQVDLVQELSALIEQTQHLHPNVEVSYTKPEAVPLKTNALLVRQALSNLLCNAFAYADKTHPQVRVVLELRNGGIRVEIENNGLTISKEAQTQVFAKFFRAAEAQAYKAVGTGLGLFITKLICDAFGWKIHFESPAPNGAGAVFFLDIPRAEPST